MWKDHRDKHKQMIALRQREAIKILIDGDYALTFHLPSYSYRIWTE